MKPEEVIKVHVISVTKMILTTSSTISWIVMIPILIMIVLVMVLNLT